MYVRKHIQLAKAPLRMQVPQFLIHMGADVSYVYPRGDNAVIMAAASANTVAWNKLQRLPATSL